MVDEIDFEPFEKPVEKKATQKGQALPVDYSADFIQVGRRVKVIEGAVNNLRRKILVNEQNDLNRNKKVQMDQKTTLGEINEVKKDIENIKRVLREVINELKGCAKKEEMDVLKKYINLWNPVKFVTESTVEKMIEEKLNERKG